MSKQTYHDHLSDSLDIDNKIELPKRQDNVVVRKKLPPSEPMLFQTEEEPKEEPTKTVEIIPEEEALRDAKQDYREVRGRLHQLAETGNQALEGILAVAEESEHPRAYEVVAQLIKTLAENSKQLMELHHDTQDLEEKKNKKHQTKDKKADDEEKPQVTNNNAFFVGSTAEVQKMIEDMTKSKE